MPLTVKIIKPFLPFTSAVTLLVEPCAYMPHLPPQFVVKLGDRRFGNRAPQRRKLLWTPDVEPSLYQGVRDLLSGSRPNFFKKIGPVSKEEPEYSLWPDWMWEISCWQIKDENYKSEVKAYRHLASLQGTSIPRFYGTAQLSIAPQGRPPLHAVTDVVDGIVMEYIQGTTLEELQVGRDVSPTLAEEISQKALRVMRQVRDLDTIHGDVRLGNILLRGWPSSAPEPVLIDFGFAHIRPADGSEWTLGREVNFLRLLLHKSEVGLPWHPVMSPFAQEVLEDYAAALGYEWQNQQIESLPTRDAQFERVPGTEGRKGQVLQWRVKAGVRTRQEDDD